MGVTGHVGLMGSGKTRAVVKAGIKARDGGRDVFANFRFGDRVDGWMVPTCDHWGCGNYDQVGVHLATNTVAQAPDAYEFRKATGPLDELGRRNAWRRGRGFIPWVDAKLLTSWSQLEALRVHRDELGSSHKVNVIESGVDDEGQPTYSTERACRVYDCPGCSKGITVLIDELNLWAPSRLWAQLGIGVLQRWAYARKDGLDIVWSAQHEARVDKVAREVTDHIWSNTAFGGTFPGLPLRLQVFHRVRWIPALLNDSNRTNATEGAQGGGLLDHVTNSENDVVIRFGRQLSTKEEDAYDTYEHVSSSGHLSAKRSAPQAPSAAVVPISSRRASSAPPASSLGRPTRTREHPEGRSEAKESG